MNCNKVKEKINLLMSESEKLIEIDNFDDVFKKAKEIQSLVKDNSICFFPGDNVSLYLNYPYSCYQKIGFILKNANKYDDAINYFEKAKQEVKSNSSLYIYKNNFINMANVYIEEIKKMKNNK